MKKKSKGGGGGANWMDTYGDMVTLLLCFFVLLYSMSTISEEKYKAMVMSFNPDAAETLKETSGDEGPNADPNTEEGSGMSITQEQVEADMESLYQELKDYVSREGAQSSISVTHGNGKVYVSFNQAVFFDGEKWALRQESKPILDVVSKMLSDVEESIEEVRITGHTAQGNPNIPNDPVVDRVLSAQRAANVLAYIQTKSTLDPARMISEGCGQWRPVASNDTSEGRAQNRRVEMMVSGRNLTDEISPGVQHYQTEAK